MSDHDLPRDGLDDRLDDGPDDLADRFSRLAPALDPDAAFASVMTATRADPARTRSFPFLSVAAAVLAFVLIAGALLAANRSWDVDIDTGSSTTLAPSVTLGTTPVGTTPTNVGTTPAPAGTVPPSTVTVPIPAPGGPTTTTAPTSLPASTVPTIIAPQLAALPSEVELVVRPDREAVRLGERIHFEIEVINHSSAPAYFASLGCGNGWAQLVGLPEGNQTSTAAWSTAAGSLGSYLATSNSRSRMQDVMPAELAQARGGFGCWGLNLDTLAPGGRKASTWTWDPTVAPGSADLPSSMAVLVTVQVGTKGVDGQRGDGVKVAKQQPFRIVDDANAHRSIDPAVASIEADTIVRGYLDAHGESKAGVDFRNGQWEFWFEPIGGVEGPEMSRLRVRTDPTTGTITEIRMLGLEAPDDDPDATWADPTKDRVLYPT